MYLSSYLVVPTFDILTCDDVLLPIYIGGGTRGARGATAPPDFKIYAFGPPRFQNQKLTNIARGLCVHVAMWKSKNLSTIQGCPFLFRPPQVVTCSSASDIYRAGSTGAIKF